MAMRRVYSILCTVYSIQYTVHSTQYTVYSIQHRANSIQCTVHSIQRDASAVLHFPVVAQRLRKRGTIRTVAHQNSTSIKLRAVCKHLACGPAGLFGDPLGSRVQRHKSCEDATSKSMTVTQIWMGAQRRSQNGDGRRWAPMGANLLG